MKLTTELAYPILAKLRELLDYNINIMDDKGMIVASSDVNRIDQIHEGSLKVIQTKQSLVIYSSDVKDFSGTKPGVNLPIEFLGEVIGVVGVTGHPDDLYKFASVMKVTVEVMIQQVYVNNQIHYQNQVMEGWILDLIHPYGLDSKKVEANAKHLLNINTSDHVCVFLLQFMNLSMVKGNYKNPKQLIIGNERKTTILHDLKILTKPVFISFIDNECCLVGISCNEKNVEKEKAIGNNVYSFFETKGYNLIIGIGNCRNGILGYRQSYLEAKQSLSLNMKLNEQTEISHISDWGFIRLLDYIPQKIRKEYLDEYLGEVEKINEELRRTIEVFFDHDFSMKITSEKLHIHRNTLIYRLNRIQKLLNLDPRKFEDALLLKALLLFKKFEC